MASQQMHVLGVDPGLSGALAIYSLRSAKLVEVFDMPLWVPGENSDRAKREVDPYALAKMVDCYAASIRLACVEDVGGGSYHGRTQGSVSAFSFGRSQGVVLGVLGTYSIPIRFVAPAGWKLSMGLTSSKNVSRERASKLFPDHAKAFARAKDDGRAEAALLSYFGARGLAHALAHS